MKIILMWLFVFVFSLFAIRYNYGSMMIGIDDIWLMLVNADHEFHIALAFFFLFGIILITTGFMKR